MWPLGVLKKPSSNILLDAAKVKLLLHFDGNFNDSSNDNVTVTSSGNTEISTINPKFGSGCYRNLTTPRDGKLTTANFFDFSANRPFTLSFWIRDGDGNGAAISIHPDGFSTAVITVTIPGEVRVGNVALTTIGATINIGPLSSGSYKNIVIIGDGTNIKTYVNGILVGTPVAHPNWVSVNSPLIVGNTKIITGTTAQLGRIDEVLLYDGVLWVGNFTPPTAPFTF